jgi:hypothetical protein
VLDDEPLTTAELLEQWREAAGGAACAERLAKLARTSVERSDRDSAAAQEIARIAERAARHAERAATIAREAANRAMAFAAENRDEYLAEAELAAKSTVEQESAARNRYHEAVRGARDRQGGGLTEP